MPHFLQWMLDIYLTVFFFGAAYSQTLRWRESGFRPDANEHKTPVIVPVCQPAAGLPGLTGAKAFGAAQTPPWKKRRPGQINQDDHYYIETADEWVDAYVERRDRWLRAFTIRSREETSWEQTCYSAAHRKSHFN